MNNAKGPYEYYTDYIFMDYCFKHGLMDMYHNISEKRILNPEAYKILKKIKCR